MALTCSTEYLSSSSLVAFDGHIRLPSALCDGPFGPRWPSADFTSTAEVHSWSVLDQGIPMIDGEQVTSLLWNGDGALYPALIKRCFLVRFPSARAFSSVGRALPLQGRGRRFKPVNAHEKKSLLRGCRMNPRNPRVAASRRGTMTAWSTYVELSGISCC